MNLYYNKQELDTRWYNVRVCVRAFPSEVWKKLEVICFLFMVSPLLSGVV